MLFIIMIAIEIILAIILYFIYWVYGSEDHLVWCNDIDIIEALHGNDRTTYLQQGKKLTKQLVYSIMLAFLLLGLPIPESILFPLLFIVVLILAIYHLILNFKLQKDAKIKIAKYKDIPHL